MYNNKCSGNNNIVISKCNLFKIKVLSNTKAIPRTLFTDYDSIYSITILTFLSFILQILIKPFRTLRRFYLSSLYRVAQHVPQPTEPSVSCVVSCHGSLVGWWVATGFFRVFLWKFVGGILSELS